MGCVLDPNDGPVNFELGTGGQEKTMRYGMQKPWFWGAVIFMCCAPGAFADVFTLTGVTPSAQMGGVYTSPYIASIQTGSTTQTGVNVICDDFSHEVWIGESWTVTATALSQLPLLGSSSPVLWDTSATAPKQVTDYLTAAILAEELLSFNPSSQQAEDLSFAMWDVFTPGASNGLADNALITGAGGYLPTAQALAAADIANAGGNLEAALSPFSNVTIYTANPKSGGAVIACPSGVTCNAPQEFITVTMAEPPSPALLGLDLLAVAGLIFIPRRRFAGSVN
jgi:hypothetical protein